MELIRGDTYLFKVRLKNITLDEIDTLFITCRKDIYSKDFIFQKTINDVSIDNDLYVHFAFNPSDTQALPYGDYVFDIEVTLKSGIMTFNGKTLDKTAFIYPLYHKAAILF